jgi:ketosteroid isomerase-like protein
VNTLLVPSANVDFVRSICAAWERGDFSSVEWADPEIEYVIADGVEPGSWTGRAGLAEGWRGWLSGWEEIRIETEEYRELDEERVLVLYHARGRGKTSGLDLQQMRAKGASIFQIGDGKVTRLVAYNDADRALADLGLPLEADSSRP